MVDAVVEGVVYLGVASDKTGFRMPVELAQPIYPSAGKLATEIARLNAGIEHGPRSLILKARRTD